MLESEWPGLTADRRCPRSCTLIKPFPFSRPSLSSQHFILTFRDLYIFLQHGPSGQSCRAGRRSTTTRPCLTRRTVTFLQPPLLPVCLPPWSLYTMQRLRDKLLQQPLQRLRLRHLRSQATKILKISSSVPLRSCSPSSLSSSVGFNTEASVSKRAYVMKKTTLFQPQYELLEV